MISTCRTCLMETFDYKSLAEIIEIDGKIETFADIFSLCTGLEFSDQDQQFSNDICLECSQHIIDSFTFRQKCWYSQHTLNEAIKEKNLTDLDYIVEEIEYEDNIEWAPDLEPMNSDSDSEKNVKVEELEKFTELTKSDIKCMQENSKKKCVEKGSAAKTKPKRIRKRRSKEKEYICPYCGRTITGAGNLNAHVRIHTGEKPFKCHLCDYSAAQPIHSHLLSIHGTEKNWFCDFPGCGKSYKLKTTLVTHKLVHDDPKFKCPICNKMFHKPLSLKDHIRIHNPDDYFTCEICDKKFPRKSKLLEHQRVHTQEFIHNCDECGKGFIQRHCWRTHMERHHKKIVK